MCSTLVLFHDEALEGEWRRCMVDEPVFWVMH